MVGELIWFHRLLTELNITNPSSVAIYCDSQSIIHISHNLVFHKRTKHIEVDYHFVRNKLPEGLIFFSSYSTTDQLADIFTKAFTDVKYTAILNKLVVIITTNLRRGIEGYI